MIKKYVLAGAVIAGMLATQVAWSPAKKLSPPKTLPEASLENIMKETFHSEKQDKFEEELRKFKRRQELSERDQIYRTIYSFYENKLIPEYIPMEFIRSIIRIESSDYPKALGKVGERGLGQQTKAAWYEVRTDNFEKNAFIPEKSIEATIDLFLVADKFCRENNSKWNELTDEEKRGMIAAAYNGGKGRLIQENWNIDKMAEITRGYVKTMKRFYDKFSSS